jgi:DNA-binding LytR/AlgR family response regulator
MPIEDGIVFLQRLADVKFKNSVVLMSGEDEYLLHAAHALAERQKLNILGVVTKPIKSETVANYLKMAKEKNVLGSLVFEPSTALLRNST